MRVSRVSGVAVFALVASVLGPATAANADPPAPPTAAITSPPDGTTVTGPITINAEGHLDPTSPDSVTGLQLYVAGSAVAGQQVGCTVPPSDTFNCYGSFSYDPTVLGPGTYALQVDLLTTGMGASSPPVQITVPVPPPTVTFLGPVSTPATGPVSIAVSGTTNAASTDTPASIDLTWGGTDIGSQLCPGVPSAHDCPLSFEWDTTGLNGTHDLTATLTTAGSIHVTTQAVVEARNPKPRVTIHTPAPGETRSGVITVTATATISGPQRDHPDSMQLYLNDTKSPVPGQRVECSSSATCDGTFTWDATGATGTVDLIVGVHTARDRTNIGTVRIHVTSPGPTVIVHSPTNGATVSGPVTIVTTGTVNSKQNDTPKSMQLLTDGKPLSGPQACTGTASAPRSCSRPFRWDTTGMSGAHTLQAKFLTHRGSSALSPLTTITVVSPLPKVVITSPSARSTVHRTATIKVSGAVDPSQTDTPSSLRLTLDGAALGGVIPCSRTAAAPRACHASYTWSTLGLTGRHTLVASLVSGKGAVGTSSATPVYVYGGTKTMLAKTKAHVAGRSVTYIGRVITLINKRGVPGVKVKVVIRPAVGKAKTVYVRTDARGYFKVPFRPAVNSSLTATLVSLPYYGSSHSSTKLRVVPRAACTVGSTIRRNSLDHGSCTFRGLPRSTKVTLQYQFRGHWYTLGAGRAPGATIPFSFRFAVRGSYLVRLALSGTSLFAATTGPALKVRVT
ncbi:MAG: hypothetical protein QOF82_3063 [Frankiales bacterium]|nr:hypothetical protein [Frankiales bacterium]